MARIETNKAPRKIIVEWTSSGDLALHANETDTGTLLAHLSVVDKNTLDEFLHNVITVEDQRFEIRGGDLYLKPGVHLPGGKFQLDLTVTDAHDATLTKTQQVKFNVAAPTHFTGSVDASATKADGTMLFGTGNPSTDYTIAINDRAGVEFGFNVHYRTGDQIAGHLEADGFVHFDAPSGHQIVDSAHSVGAEATSRSAVSVDYALITGMYGTDREVTEYVVRLFIDLDPSAAQNYKAFTLVNFGVGSNFFVADDGVGGLGDTIAPPTVAEDSINFGYSFLTNSLTDYTGDFRAGTYDMIAEVWDLNEKAQLVGNHIVLDVV